MKRSEMIQYIVDEIGDINSALEQLGNEDYSSFMKRKATGMLDMLEGFGMQPPNITLEQLIPCELQTSNEQEKHWYACWEPEDE
jgi:hypothetical protein